MAAQVGQDGTRSGWLADDGRRLEAFAGAAAIDWRTADCGPGDVVVLGELCNMVRRLDTAGMTVCGVTYTRYRIGRFIDPAPR